MDSTEHYLGFNDLSGKLTSLISFSKKINSDGKTMELYFLPSRKKTEMDIEEARSYWKEKLKEGFSKIDKERAKLFLTNLNSQRDRSRKEARRYVSVDRTKEPLGAGVQKILESRRSSKTTRETITEVLFNEECEYSFTSYSKDDEKVIVRYLEYEIDKSKTEEYKKEDARNLWNKLIEENFRRLSSTRKKGYIWY